MTFRAFLGLAPQRAGLAAVAFAAFAAAAVSVSGASAGVLDRMKETGEIRLAVRADARPLSYMEGGAPLGYSVSVCQEAARRIARRLGMDSLKYAYVKVTAADRFAAIAEGRADLLCGAATVTIKRRETVDFSLYTFIDGASVLLPADGSPDFEALAGKRIGVLGGTTTEQSLRLTLESAGMDAEVVVVAAHDEGLAKLTAGALDAYFGDQSILYHLLARAPDPRALRVGANVLTVEPHGLALPLGDTAFRREVDRALSRMYRSGDMESIFREAFPGAKMGAGMRALMLVIAQPD